MSPGFERSIAAADASARSVALAVLRSGPVSRADLARRLGLSTASLTRLTRPMISSGLLVEQEPETGKRTGRPSKPLDIDAGQAHFLGIKITWDVIYTVVCDLKGTVISRASAAVPDTSPEVVIDQALAIVTDHRLAWPGIAGVGIGIGGTVEGHSLVRRVSALGWNRELDLAHRLAAAIELPVSVDNDVRALTQAELWFGEGRGCSSLVMITIGVGVGCALVIDDQLYEGRRGLAAKIDHWSLDPDGPQCPRGHRGCADQLLTSGRISERATQRLDRPVSFEECLRLAGVGDPAAGDIVQRAAAGLGLLVSRVADLIAPERILLTGDGIELAMLAEDRMRAAVAANRSLAADADDVRLLRSDFYVWARGAAAVAIRRHMLTELSVT
ncbi:ROK family transcriptional regulator [Microlunatus sp. Gsoil 973]|uniref:ROK family transcriptional regulator n=1 Tax=Microlunatus sp. Gsoil 973 TaxID=2672569 RepID=UPI0012B4C3A3|nr:ROK family transcriptional regulator [Microlunatus sp. Gsoil 973]QGN31814.1 ROK family protein [Microlunatus sp. Gsoil 973]